MKGLKDKLNSNVGIKFDIVETDPLNSNWLHSIKSTMYFLLYQLIDAKSIWIVSNYYLNPTMFSN